MHRNRGRKCAQETEAPTKPLHPKCHVVGSPGKSLFQEGRVSRPWWSRDSEEQEETQDTQAKAIPPSGFGGEKVLSETCSYWVEDIPGLLLSQLRHQFFVHIIKTYHV